MSFNPLPVPVFAFKLVPEQKHSPLYELGLVTNQWGPYLAKYPTGNPDDFQVAFNNSVINQGNRGSFEAMNHYITQVQNYNLNKGSAGAWGPLPVPVAPPAQVTFYVPASKQNLAGTSTVKPWVPGDFFGS